MKTLLLAGFAAISLSAATATAQESPGGGIGWEQVAPKASAPAPAAKTVPGVHFTGSQVRTFWLRSQSANTDMLIGGDGPGG